jgi:hypothetical protein
VTQHCRWEHKQTHPSVMEKVQAIEERSCDEEGIWMKMTDTSFSDGKSASHRGAFHVMKKEYG